MDEFLALAWKDDTGPHVVTGVLEFANVEQEEPAEFARYCYTPAPPIRIRPPMMRHTYVIDGTTYTLSWWQEHKLYFKKEEEKMEEFKYTDEDGDKLELDSDNTLRVIDRASEYPDANEVWVRSENIGPLVYHLLENDGAATTLAPESKDADADVCRNMILSYAKRLMDIGQEEEKEDDRLFDLAVALRAAFTNISEVEARKLLTDVPTLKKQALKWARDVERSLPGNKTKTLEYEDRKNPDQSVTWQANDDAGYFSYRLGKWYYSPELEGNFRAYDVNSFSYLDRRYFPMTAV